MRKKPFDRKLFHENDARARVAVIVYLHNQGLVAQDNDDQYGVDLLIRRPDSPQIIYAVEVEVKHVWSGDTLPWSSVQLPARKLRYAQETLVPVEYWILNRELTHAIVIYEKSLVDRDPIEVYNKYVSRGEFFYQIPLEETDLIGLSGESQYD